MPNPLIVLIAGGILAGPILAILALVRSLRIGELERQVRDLEDRVDWLELGPPLKGERAPVPEAPPFTADQEPAPPAAPAGEAPVEPRLEALPVQLGGASFGSGGEPPSKPPPPAPGLSIPGAPVPPPLTVPRVPIDWERWIGLRGAALLGAVALGLAGLLFFKYSVEHGLITPIMRVVTGTITGLGCLVGAEWLRGRNYRATAEGIAGAGLVVLYAAFWAAHVLYGLIPMAVTFGLMALVTVTGCLLALRQDSRAVAIIGLVGGFATPLLLVSGSDRPVGLFGYVLLLDLGLLFVAQRRRWPSLGFLSLLATVLMQGLWIGARMGPERLALGLVILGVFAALFVFAGRALAGPETVALWRWSRIGAVLFPFAFAFYFAARADLGPRLYPIGILLALLGAGAGWVARDREALHIATAAATATVAVVAVWLIRHPLGSVSLAWETVAVAAGLALVHHVFVEIEPGRVGPDSPATAAMIATGGLFVLLLVSSFAIGSVWPHIAGWTLLAAVLYRHGGFPGREVLQVSAAVGLGLGLSILHLVHGGRAFFPAASIVLGTLVAAAVLSHVVALVRRDGEVRLFADRASAALPVVLVAGLVPSAFTRSLDPVAALGTALLLGLLAGVATTRKAEDAWYAAAVGAVALVHLTWTWDRAGLRDRPTEVLAALLIGGIAVAVFTFWPLLAGRRFAGGRLAWYAAALAGPVWFAALRRLFEMRFGDDFIGLLPIVLGAIALGAAQGARRVLGPADEARLRALVWFAAVALCFVAVAIPLQLEKQWITIGWALEGLAVIALWTRLDHPGLKYFGLALLAAATLRLIVNPAVLGYYPRSSLRILNWLLYTYLVPAAASIVSGALLKPREIKRARDWENGVYGGGHPVGAIGAGLAAIALIFVWINLAIADWFATGEVLRLSFGDQPAQRLTVSIAWAIYALVLLGLGMHRRALGLRWMSLAFLLVTIGKVFLYDLGALRDLYRVASLLGLAVSLILVSLLYQRFVFRARREGES